MTIMSVLPAFAQPLPGGSLDPTTIPKYAQALPIPGVMPLTATLDNNTIDYYEIAARQISQQVLPTGMPKTTVWGYGPAAGSATYPARTIEAQTDRPVRVKWINDLKNAKTGKFLPHLLPVDQTLHWANPPQDCIDGTPRTDCRGQSQAYYTGPVPISTHLHGAHVTPESDGYPEAWYLPNATNIPAGYATQGSNFGQISGVPVQPGAAVFQYRNDQRATTLWYHDHTIGITRSNVYTGLAGFYLLRGGSSDLPAGVLPSGKFEIPLVMQDKSFNSDGSLFYSGNRAFFEGLAVGDLRIPFIPDPVVYNDVTFPMSDVSPTWNPEFFGNTMVVNGKTWPYLEVQQKRYRFRILNANDTRVLILTLSNGQTIWQIGNEGGFMPAPVQQSQILIAGAERADVIIDFTNVPVGTKITLLNIGPDEPFGGGAPGVDFASADPGTTGQVMQFRVVKRVGGDGSTPPGSLMLPTIAPLGPETHVRQVTLNEFDSSVVIVKKVNGRIQLASSFNNPGASAFFFGPIFSMLGTLGNDGFSSAFGFPDLTTEEPALGSTEIWEMYNFTADAHPIHVHQVAFEVIDRQDLELGPDGLAAQPAVLVGAPRPPDPHEAGLKDTVLVYPGGVTRIKMHFDIPGLYVWHCHILSHEDNEMMRPLCVGGGCTQ
ncbi:MAG: multicopper oxidase domain-containing protein [Candidatus Methylomirabilis oxyfera]|nr:multicopper oxidase domain-containing protein [Candidatus Methylomirabilis oxyfera]